MQGNEQVRGWQHWLLRGDGNLGEIEEERDALAEANRALWAALIQAHGTYAIAERAYQRHLAASREERQQ